MKQLHTFDEVFDSQKVFRKALEVLSNPGRTRSIAEQSEKLYGEQPGLLALAMTLLDAMRFYLSSGIQMLLQDMLFGIVFAAIGLIGIRSRVLSYTHESQWLRRSRKRK